MQGDAIEKIVLECLIAFPTFVVGLTALTSFVYLPILCLTFLPAMCSVVCEYHLHIAPCHLLLTTLVLLHPLQEVSATCTLLTATSC